MTTNEDATDISTKSSSEQVEHIYYEIGNELLDKTNALCDLLEVEQIPPTAIFCNNRSDADFVAAILKKRDITTYKIEGEFQRGSISSALRTIRHGEAQALICTDDVSSDLDLDDFALVVNYSPPGEPEVYLHRCETTTPESKLKKVISLVGPLDVGNFHFIKKVVGIELVPGELPSPEAVYAARIDSLAEQAVESDFLKDEAIKKIVDQISSHKNRDQLVALLVNNTVNVIPSLKKSDSRQSSRGHSYNRSDVAKGGSRQNRGRGGDRPRNGRRHSDNRENRGRRAIRSGNGSSQRDWSPDGRRSDRRPRRDSPPPPKDTRIYIGHGSRTGFSHDKFLALVNSHCQDLPEKAAKRFSLRDCYSFVDFPEEIAESVIDQLSSVEMDDGVKFFCKKATSIAKPRERQPQANGNIKPAEEQNSDTPPASVQPQEIHEASSSDVAEEAQDENR